VSSVNLIQNADGNRICPQNTARKSNESEEMGNLYRPTLYFITIFQPMELSYTASPYINADVKSVVSPPGYHPEFLQGTKN
jgi:hypothetical protein